MSEPGTDLFEVNFQLNGFSKALLDTSTGHRSAPGSSFDTRRCECSEREDPLQIVSGDPGEHAEITSRLLALPENCWELLSCHVGANGLWKLVSIGCRRLTQLLQRSAVVLDHEQKLGRLLDINCIFRNATYFNHLHKLSVTSWQRVIRPIALGTLPRCLRELHVACSFAATTFIPNAALPIVLPSLEVLCIKSTEIYTTGDQRSLSLQCLPSTLKRLDLILPDRLTVSMQELAYLPTSITSLRLEAMIGPLLPDDLDFCLVLRRRLPHITSLTLRSHLHIPLRPCYKRPHRLLTSIPH